MENQEADEPDFPEIKLDELLNDLDELKIDDTEGSGDIE